ncbi:MAG: hypothetical protein ACKOA8_15850 [Deltaproteobacteria bacterium]
MPTSSVKDPWYGQESELEVRLRSAVQFFQQRAPVIFVSHHYEYWDQHGFVQQSLAKELVKWGIPVEWYDGAHWKKKNIVKNWDSSLLKVSKLPCLPLRRFPWVESINPLVQSQFIQTQLKKGEKPLLWIQSGLDERVVERLPYVDVFSVFDDPYLHAPNGNLSSLAQLIVTQNSFTLELFQKHQKSKAIYLPPPVEMEPQSFDDQTEYLLPESFPKRTMGYIGSFFSDGFDLILFENFIRSFPDWGFILCGRTDALGLAKIQSWKSYKNFLYVPWVPRKKVGALWRKLKVNLMLYRPASVSDGAFPVKFLEALYYRVPSLTTQVPKTSSLEGIIPRLTFPDQLKIEAIKLVNFSSGSLDNLYQKFSLNMSPQWHLIQVAERLQQKGI